MEASFPPQPMQPPGKEIKSEKGANQAQDGSGPSGTDGNSDCRLGREGSFEGGFEQDSPGPVPEHFFISERLMRRAFPVMTVEQEEELKKIRKDLEKWWRHRFTVQRQERRDRKQRMKGVPQQQEQNVQQKENVAKETEVMELSPSTPPLLSNSVEEWLKKVKVTPKTKMEFEQHQKKFHEWRDKGLRQNREGYLALKQLPTPLPVRAFASTAARAITVETFQQQPDLQNHGNEADSSGFQQQIASQASQQGLSGSHNSGNTGQTVLQQGPSEMAQGFGSVVQSSHSHSFQQQSSTQGVWNLSQPSHQPVPQQGPPAQGFGHVVQSSQTGSLKRKQDEERHLQEERDRQLQQMHEERRKQNLPPRQQRQLEEQKMRQERNSLNSQQWAANYGTQVQRPPAPSSCNHSEPHQPGSLMDLITRPAESQSKKSRPGLKK